MKMEDVTKLLEELKPMVAKTKKELLGLNMKKKSIFKNNQEQYVITDFTEYSGKDFIKNAFQKILKRSPENEAIESYLNYMKILSKVEILINIRYSKEGRKNNVNILGLKKRYFFYKLINIPIIGYFISLIISFFLLPKIIKRIDNFLPYRKENVDYENTKCSEIKELKYEVVYLKNQLKEIQNSQKEYQDKLNEMILFKKAWFNK